MRGEQNENRLQRRKRRKLNYFIRLLLLAGAGIFGAWALFLVMIKAVHPYKLGFQQAQEIAVLKKQLHEQENYNAEKRRQLAYLVSAEGAESEARRAHFHRPGEVVYLLDSDALTAVRRRGALARQSAASGSATTPPPSQP